MIRFLLLLILALFYHLHIIGQTPEYVKTLGGIDTDAVYDMATDSEGNIVMTGFFKNALDFDPGPGLFEMTSEGGDDIFILKLNPDGEFIWAKQIGAPFDQMATSLSIDPLNNIVIGGSFYGTVDFDPGAGTAELTSVSLDAFVCKLDFDGNYVYARNLSESISSDETFSVAADLAGNVYAVGRFTYNLGTSGVSSNGQNDIFIVKMNAAGSTLWAHGFGEAWDDYGFDVTVDNTGNTVFLTGFFRRTVDFDPGANIAELVSDSNSPDAFVLRLDADGNYIWAGRFGGDYTDRGYSIQVDQSGNVYLNGIFAVSGDFDPGLDVYELFSGGASTNAHDHFLLRLNPDYSLNWASNLNMNSFGLFNAPYFGSSLLVTSDEKILETGFFQSTADFDPGVSQYLLTSVGSRDIFLRKMDIDGNLDWAASIGGPSSDVGFSVASPSNNEVLLAGNFRLTVDFDPGSGVLELSSNLDSDDFFLLKLSESPGGHEILLPEGWSGISSYIFPASTPLEDVFASIENELIIAQTMNGVYFPEQNLNTIGNWESQSAYKVKTSGEVVLTIDGEMEANLAVPLQSGWNLLPVLTSTEVIAADIFAQLTNLVIVKDVASTGVYWPDYGINTLEMLQPGKAYYAYLSAPETIDYSNFKQSAAGNINSTEMIKSKAHADIQPTSSTHIIAFSPSIANLTGSGTILGAYDANGRCFGSTQFNSNSDYMVLFGDDPTTDNKDGFFEGETFLLFAISDGEPVVAMNASFDDDLPHHNGKFNKNGLSAVLELKNSDNHPNQLSPVIQPNPTSGNITVFDLQENDLVTVFNLQGRMITKATAIRNNVELDLSSQKSGVYLMRIQSDSRIFNEKIIVE